MESATGVYDACDPAAVTQIIVSGAGAAEWNGVYTRADDVWNVPGGITTSFQMDATHEIYNSAGVWRLADYGVATYYVAGGDGPAGNAMPPRDGFIVTGGMDPPPRLAVEGC